MRYSQMSSEQRQQLLDRPENYPLRVKFLGKVGILTYEEVAFLRQRNVDFDVDDGQVEEILAELLETGEVPAPPRGILLRIASTIVSVFLIWKRAKDHTN